MEPMRLGFPKKHAVVKFVTTRETLCSAAELNNVGIWTNFNHRKWSFEERVCCNVVESSVTGSLPITEVKDKACK